MSARRSSSGLMLVEDPKDTIRALCELNNATINWHSYKEKYEKVKSLSRSISSQHNDTHFYSLSIYGIIRPTESSKTEYRISPVGKGLCKSLTEGHIDDYKKILSNILLNNPKKGRLYREFINFVKIRNKASYDDVLGFTKELADRISLKRKSKETIEIISRTLMAWSEEAGMIGRDKDRKTVWFVSELPKPELAMQAFWEVLLDKYKQLRHSEIFGIEHIYVDILELRTIVCADLSITTEDFDAYLTSLLDSKVGDKIRLYGAPTSFFTDKENFTYKGKVYAYITIKV